MLPTRSTFIATIVLFGFFLASIGSAQAADGKLSGMVRVAGKALPSGKIFFHLKGGQFVGCVISDGKYTVDRIPAGEHKVTIEGKGVQLKYADPETSPLAVRIKEGPAIVDIEIE